MILTQKALTLSVIAYISLAAPVEDSDLTGCAVTLKGYLYNLKELSLDKDYESNLETEDGHVDINFNICHHTKRQCNDGVPDFANQIN